METLKKCGVVFVAFLLTSSVWAKGLPTASEIIANPPSQSNELFLLVTELSERVGEIQSYRQFQSYFSLLPMFEGKFVEFGMDTIYPDLIENLGDRLASHGMRWIRFESTPVNEIDSLTRAMQASTLLRFLDLAENQIAFVSPTTDYRQIGLALRTVTQIAIDKYPTDSLIDGKVTYLTSTLSERVLTSGQDLSFADFEFWLSGLVDATTIENFLLFLFERVLDVQKSDYKILADQVLATGAFLKDRRVTLSTKNIFGDIFTEFLAKSLKFEIDLDLTSLSLAADQLGTLYLKNAAFRLQNLSKMPSASFTGSYLEVVKLITEKITERGLLDVSEDLLRSVEKRFAAVIAVQKDYEGTYRLLDLSGKSWILTLVRATEDRLIANMSQQNGLIHINFFEVVYSLNSGHFKALEYVPDDESFPNLPAELIFSKEGDLTLEMPFSNEVTARTLRGKRTEVYTDYFSQAVLDAEIIEGRYQGQLQLPSGSLKSWILTIAPFDQFSVGRLQSLDGRVQVQLQTGTQGGEGFIYLTAGQSVSARSWIHLRLLQNPEDLSLNGEVVVGGRGRGQAISFEKIE